MTTWRFRISLRVRWHRLHTANTVQLRTSISLLLTNGAQHHLFIDVHPIGMETPRKRVSRAFLRLHGQFNIIDGSSGYKADIMIPSNSALDKKRFARARRIRPLDGNRTYWFSSPEDLIIKKLEFYREGQSEKHLRDIASIVQIMGDKLEMQYIQEWAARLNLDEIWRSILDRLNMR